MIEAKPRQNAQREFALPLPDLAQRLIEAIQANREAINAEAEVFVGRISFHVDLDVNVSMKRVTTRVRPHKEPCPE